MPKYKIPNTNGLLQRAFSSPCRTAHAIGAISSHRCFERSTQPLRRNRHALRRSTNHRRGRPPSGRRDASLVSSVAVVPRTDRTYRYVRYVPSYGTTRPATGRRPTAVRRPSDRSDRAGTSDRRTRTAGTDRYRSVPYRTGPYRYRNVRYRTGTYRFRPLRRYRTLTPVTHVTRP